MKKNLLKILAIGAIAVSMGACSTEKAKVVNITELLTINADTKGWELEGKLVKIENLVLQGKYGNTLIGGASVGNTIVDLRGVEIQTKKLPEFKLGSGYGADITAEGRVVDVNGRLTLQNAKVTVNSERDYDNPPADGSAKYSGGLPMSYCPADYLSRSLWDGYFGRTFSGALYEGTFQLASVPGTLSATAATSFKVVFPGENLDIEDEENYSIINVAVPNQVSDGAIESFNEYFDGLEVGDFVTLCGLLQYDSQANLGMGYVLENFWDQAGLTEVEDEPIIFQEWAEVESAAYGFTTQPLPDLDMTNVDVVAPFSYTLDTGYFTRDIEDLFSDPSSIMLFKDYSDVGLLEVVANIKPSAVDGYLTAVKEKLEAASWELAAGSIDDGALLFGLPNPLDDEDALAEIIIEVSDSGSYITMDYMAPRLHHTVQSLAADMTLYSYYMTEGQLALSWADHPTKDGAKYSVFAAGTAASAEAVTQTVLFGAALTALMFVPDYCTLISYGYVESANAFVIVFSDLTEDVRGTITAYAQDVSGTIYVVDQIVLEPFPEVNA